MKVLVCDKLAPEGLEILKKAAGLEVEVKTKLPKEELLQAVRGVEAIVVRSATKITQEVVDAADRLKVVGRAGIGFDNIDIEAATKRGVVVMNTPEGNVATTAEHALSMLCSLARRIPQATASVKAGKWERERFMGVELQGKTLGIVGVGRIGGAFAERARGLKMNVLAFDPYLTRERAQALGITLVTLDDLLAQSHFITVHTPLTDETRGLLGVEALKKVRPGVLIVNCARGGVVDEEALAAAIREGRVGGAALDVFVKEPPGADHPLLKLDQVICTPHLGASTEEAQLNVAIAVAQQIADYLLRGIVRNAVNLPALGPEEYVRVRPFLDLADRLGRFLAQLHPHPVVSVEIELSGEAAAFDPRPITSSALRGLLAPALGPGVNVVNAPVLARDRGIRVNETKTTEPSDFTNRVALRVRTEGGEGRIAGVLFGRTEPRIVLLDEFELEAVPAGNILVLNNWDRPGVLGAVGSLLGTAGVNIAGMQMGRDRPGGKAISLVQIDTPMDRAVLERLTQIPNIIAATQVSL